MGQGTSRLASPRFCKVTLPTVGVFSGGLLAASSSFSTTQEKQNNSTFSLPLPAHPSDQDNRPAHQHLGQWEEFQKIQKAGAESRKSPSTVIKTNKTTKDFFPASSLLSRFSLLSRPSLLFAETLEETSSKSPSPKVPDPDQSGSKDKIGLSVFGEDGKGDTDTFFEGALYIAISKGNEDMVEYFLNAGADVNQQDEDGFTPLMMATLQSIDKIAQLLFDRGANPNLQDENGVTALIMAVTKKDPVMVSFLLSHGADPNILDKKGCSPLLYASISGKDKIVKMLVDHGADLKAVFNSSNALMLASEKGHENVVQVLLESGIEMGAKTPQGLTALMIGCYFGHLGVVMKLVQHGAQVNVRDYNGLTPLMIACKHNHVDVVRFLLKNGANPNLKLRHRYTAIDLTTSPVIKKLILDHKAKNDP